MARYNFGSGEYKYFANPLPGLVDSLRQGLYPRLAPLGGRWTARLGARPNSTRREPTPGILGAGAGVASGFPAASQPYPGDLAAFLDVCATAGQTRPTPLLLRYHTGDFNCLHQDLYGEIAFPLQVTFALSRLGTDYSGGEFLLLEQRPRAQSRGQAVILQQGEAVIFATRYRPVQGTRGFYRANMRHGVSRLLSGERTTLGIIFHDAR
jgi:uncharacterized protein